MSRPGIYGRGVDRGLAITEPELQLMVHFAHVEELGAVEPLLLLRAERVVRIEVAVIDTGGIDPARRSAFARAAVGEESEPTGDLRPHPGQVEAGTDDLRVFKFLDGGRAGLMPGSFERTRRGKVPGVTNLVAEGIERHRAVARNDLAVQFEVLVAQDDVVGKAGDVNLLVRRVIGDRVGCGDGNLVIAASAPEPETILPEWSAAFRTVVANEIDLVGRVQVVRGLARNGGRGLQAVRRVHVPAGPADFVRAALGDHVQLHARRFDTRVGTAGGGLHLFERVEIEV